MVPPRTVIREQILAAAERVIAQYGYAGATTKAIAKAAHCSEGSLYNHFPDKRALFVECAFHQNAGLLDTLTALPDRVGEATVEENLVALLEAMLEFQHRLVPVLLTNWASGDHVTAAMQHAEAAKEHAVAAKYAAKELARSVRRNPLAMPSAPDPHEAMHAAMPEPLRGGPHKLIAAYLEGERALGRLRADLDTDAAAWLLMSIPFNAAFLDTVKPNIDVPLGPHDRIERCVAVVVGGMR
jgi:AcrR family transcriptional regulator